MNYNCHYRGHQSFQAAMDVDDIIRVGGAIENERDKDK
jgi:hypothetical protein